MAMPEAAIHKNYGMIAGEDDVRLTWQELVVQSVAKTAMMESFANNNLWFCVLSPNVSHHAASHCRRNDVQLCLSLPLQVCAGSPRDGS